MSNIKLIFSTRESALLRSTLVHFYTDATMLRGSGCNILCENFTSITLSYDSLLCKVVVTLTSSLAAHRCDPCVHGDVPKTCSACGTTALSH